MTQLLGFPSQKVEVGVGQLSHRVQRIIPGRSGIPLPMLCFAMSP